MKSAAELTVLTGQPCGDYPFDRGYWSREAGLPKPSEPEPAVRGWETRDRELAHQTTRGERR